MRVIDITKTKPERLTVMVYGASRAGKTEFAATWPRPIFLSDAAEGGWDTIRYMDRAKWFDPNVQPEVHGIEKTADLINELDALERRVKNKPGEIQTVVVDSLTFYADMFFAALERQAEANPTKNGKINKFELYTGLASHLRAVMLKAHALPINVVWVSLEKEPVQEGQDGGIFLAGQTATKAPAACSLWLYQRSYMVGKELHYELRTRRYGVFPAGGRFGDKLPDPIEPTYRALAGPLGMLPVATAGVKRKVAG